MVSSLILYEDNIVVYESDNSGLRPLFICIKKFAEKDKTAGKEKKYGLFDKVVGLASARLIVFSGIIGEVETNVVSEKAFDFLLGNGIKVSAKEKVKFIMNNDRTARCPMEMRAEAAASNEEFFEQLSRIFY